MNLFEMIVLLITGICGSCLAGYFAAKFGMFVRSNVSFMFSLLTILFLSGTFFVAGFSANDAWVLRSVAMVGTELENAILMVLQWVCFIAGMGLLISLTVREVKGEKKI